MTEKTITINRCFDCKHYNAIKGNYCNLSEQKMNTSQTIQKWCKIKNRSEHIKTTDKIIERIQTYNQNICKNKNTITKLDIQYKNNKISSDNYAIRKNIAMLDIEKDELCIEELLWMIGEEV